MMRNSETQTPVMSNFKMGILVGIFIGVFLSAITSNTNNNNGGGLAHPDQQQIVQQPKYNPKGLSLLSGMPLQEIVETRKKYGYCPDDVFGPKPLPVIVSRADIPALLEKEGGFKRGAELGVQRALFSKHHLLFWPSVEEYVLVDLWAQQDNYKDIANVDNSAQNDIMTGALKHVAEFKNKVKVCRNYTTNCAPQFPDGYFDYIYVDARHDFKGVYADLEAWWPKLRCGGIMAGHDYVTQPEIDHTGQKWTVNYDGTVDKTGTVVKGAVDKFFMGDGSFGHKRQIQITYRDGVFVSWVVRK